MVRGRVRVMVMVMVRGALPRRRPLVRGRVGVTVRGGVGVGVRVGVRVRVMVRVRAGVSLTVQGRPASQVSRQDPRARTWLGLG